jgi:hypothetical protein
VKQSLFFYVKLCFSTFVVPCSTFKIIIFFSACELYVTNLLAEDRDAMAPRLVNANAVKPAYRRQAIFIILCSTFVVLMLNIQYGMLNVEVRN